MPATDPSRQPELILDYLRTVMPFAELDGEELSRLARTGQVDFFQKGGILIRQGQDPPDCAWLVQRGGVRLFVTDHEGEAALLDIRGEGNFVGVNLLFRNQPAEFSVETVEDTFFIKFPKGVFLDLAGRHPGVAQFFLRTFSESHLGKVFSELRRRKTDEAMEGGLYLFGLKTGEMSARPPVTAPLSASLRQAAALMVKEGVGSLLMTDPSGEIVGIITDTDLRGAMAHGMAADAAASTIMSSPVAVIDHRESCFDALIRMMDGNLHHLGVTRDGAITGVITSHDILVAQGKSPVTLFRQLRQQRDFSGLYQTVARTPQVAGALLDEGAKAGNIVRVLSILCDLTIEKILELLHKEYGPPPLPYCFVVMGGSGRGEEVLGACLASGVILADTEDELIRKAADIYFDTFIAKAMEHLAQAGFSMCPSQITAGERKWRKTLREWREFFAAWSDEPHRPEMVDMQVLFDFRPVSGKKELAGQLRGFVRDLARTSDTLLAELAAGCASAKPPLSFFKNFIVEKDGAHKHTLDLKNRGIAPFVDFARVMALKYAIPETGTLTRFDQLSHQGRIPKDLAHLARQAFEFLLYLRVARRLHLVELGAPANDYLDPGKLSELEKRTLKDAFAVIGTLSTLARETFRLGTG